MAERRTLLWQLEVAMSLFDVVVDRLGDEEAMTPPGAGAWSVRRADDGSWGADWSEVEAEPAPPTTVAWLLWHIGWWWSDVSGRAFGAGPVGRADAPWPGSVAAMLDRVRDRHDRWRAAVETISPHDLASVDLGDRCWPLKGHPFSHVVAWVNSELMKNTAEIGVTRRVLSSRRPGQTGSLRSPS